MNRRDFLKIVGISTVGATAAFYGCTPDKKKAGESTTEVPVGKMTYRQFPPNEDKVSLLGYGCMRWPTLSAPGGDGNVIDQEEVNRLVDYAIEHGVNYGSGLCAGLVGKVDRYRLEASSARQVLRGHQNVELLQFRL